MSEPLKEDGPIQGEQGRASRPTLVVDDVYLSYWVREQERRHVRNMLFREGRQQRWRNVAAVNGVSLSAFPGEAIGVIGPNGSGKSTLLRAIAGLLSPRRGAIYASADPMLLGVGAALQPELTGRRNILLGCLAMGMRRHEALALTEGIIDFAGLGEAIDRPLRTYSSGTRARLHFAIATSMEPDILLIDEVLAVGDEMFQAKSRERINQLVERAGTVFLVTHSLPAVREMCTRAIWLRDGVLQMDGAPGAVTKAYYASTMKG